MVFAYSSPEVRLQASHAVRSFAAEMAEKYPPAPPPRKGLAKLFAPKPRPRIGPQRIVRSNAANDH